MVAAAGGFLIPVYRLTYTFGDTETMFITICQPVLCGNVTFVGSFLKLGSGTAGLLTDAVTVEIHQSDITLGFDVPRSGGLGKNSQGFVVIPPVKRFYASVQQIRRLPLCRILPPELRIMPTNRTIIRFMCFTS